MKDYTLREEDREDFILTYKVEGNTLIVYYANDEVRKYKYSIEKEKIILNKMKQQVIEADECLLKIKEEVEFLRRKGRLYNKFIIAGMILTTVILVSSVFFDLIVMLIIQLLGVVSFVNVIKKGERNLEIYELIKDKLSIIHDIEKNKCFLEVLKLEKSDIIRERKIFSFNYKEPDLSIDDIKERINSEFLESLNKSKGLVKTLDKNNH